MVTGYYEPPATFGPGDPRETAFSELWGYFLARYDPAGALEWVRWSRYSYGYAVAALADGTILVGGGFVGSSVFGTGDLTETTVTAVGDWYDAFIARYSPVGVLEWVEQAGGPDAADTYGDFVNGIDVGADETVYVTGEFTDTVTFGVLEVGETSLVSAGGTDVFVARLAADGSTLWARRVGGVDNDYGQGIAVLSDGSAVVAGLFRETATFGAGEAGETVLTSAGGQDGFVARYGADGALLWVRQFGASGSDWALGVSAAPGDAAVVTGMFVGTVALGAGEPGATTLMSDSYDLMVARYGPDGSLDWANSAEGTDGTDEHDTGTGVSVLSDGTVIVGAYFSSSITFATGLPEEITLASDGSYDGCVAEFAADGTFRWARRLGGAGGDFLRSVSATASGAILGTGSFHDTAVFGPGEAGATTLTSGGEGDVFVMSLAR